MPILSPLSKEQTEAVLKEVRRPAAPESDEVNLKELLRNNNLSADETLDTLAAIMRGAENESTRLRACELAVKLNGLISDGEGAKIPIINIIIKDSESISVNPILLPREIND